MSRMLPSHVEGRARQCKRLQACGRSGKSFLVSFGRPRVRVPLAPANSKHAISTGTESLNPVCVFPFRNRVSSTEAFEGLELGEGKLSRPVLRGPGGRKAARLLGSNGIG